GEWWRNQSHGGQMGRTRRLAGNLGRHGRPEGVAGEPERCARGEQRRETSQRRRDVMLLAPAMAVLAGRVANAPEVEAQRGETHIAAPLGNPDHDRIVHVAAVQWVRMADDHTAWSGGGKAEPSFEIDAIARGESCRIFGYHTAERIAGGCCPVQS